ncbi:MAG: hypothetical protein P8Y02_06140 [Deinococcales bacterium]
MLTFDASYFGLEIVIAVIAVTATLWASRHRLRRRDPRPLEGFVRTNESFIDPTTGIHQQVWFNERTGERRYVTQSEGKARTAP